MKNNNKSKTCRVILNMPEDLNLSCKEFALKRGISKSQFIIFAVSWYLDYNKSMDLWPKFLERFDNVNKGE